MLKPKKHLGRVDLPYKTSLSRIEQGIMLLCDSMYFCPSESLARLIFCGALSRETAHKAGCDEVRSHSHLFYKGLSKDRGNEDHEGRHLLRFAFERITQPRDEAHVIQETGIDHPGRLTKL